MREIVEAGQGSSGSGAAILRKCQDLLFYGPLDKCPACDGDLKFDGIRYSCTGFYSEWATCTFLPDSVLSSPVSDLLKNYEDPSRRPRKVLSMRDKPFTGMRMSLMGRLSASHQYWRREIEKHGGKVANHVIGVTCLIASPAERDRSGTGKLAEAMERGIAVVSEAWPNYSIEKQEPQPLKAYDIVSDLAPDGRGVPWNKMDPSEEALESLSTKYRIFPSRISIRSLKMYGKRSVHKDSKLQERGGKIFEKDGILYNCAFSHCDLGRKLNDYCIIQLITVPESNLNLYYKKGKVGDDPNVEERLEEWDIVDDAVKEFVRLFEKATGNEFEPWERKKKIQKKLLKFYPIGMDDGVDVRHGGFGLRQLGVAATHCKLEPMVANFIKVLCSQEIYKYVLMEMGYDPPELPMGMLSDVHLKRCEEVLQNFVETLKSMKDAGPKAVAVWSDFGQRWFTLMHSTRPFIFKDHQELADNTWLVLPLMTPCLMDKESDDYKMILTYMEKTYEPVKVGDVVRTHVYNRVFVDNIFVIESSASPSLDEIKKLPNKILPYFWFFVCRTRSSNMSRHLHKGFLPAICSLPVPGYMVFLEGPIVCSDATPEAARYGFTTVDRPEGFLVLADIKSLEEKKVGVKGLGRKKTDESEHFLWQDDIKVPCGRLVP
ncbi:poly [ADP-ribose] polymerase 3 [Pyrus ussuriensis x Pyrus communis]|uniref:Poly [ADP-ribose] polymerase n=1 Tax=Pyrus ussuriensis x Pyrus communis TaxID=2448454 RepID=A0A5N5FTS5_9ROSA|nr:poly [ADP-ribose] polymerase 3 [Pyrus ussuriensis x Pyrus communis]